MQRFRDKLKKIGLKLTPQREQILWVLSNADTHLNPEELFLRVKKRLPRIGQATVYRNLELLTRAGILQKSDWKERHLHYELSRENHHHLICTRCGQVIEFRSAPLRQMKKISREYGFSLVQEEIRLFGLCKKCQLHSGESIHG